MVHGDKSATNIFRSPAFFVIYFLSSLVAVSSHFFHAKEGQWLVDLLIERHQDDCQIINNFNDWKLPSRYQIVRAFTKNMGKVDASSNLVVIPSGPQQLQLGEHRNYDNKIHLFFPTDETVFRYLIINIHGVEYFDMRACLNRGNKYLRTKISDKGQYHRGVVALFNDDVQDAKILTNFLWRKIIRETNDSNSNKVYSLDELLSLINALTPDELENLIEQMRFETVRNAKHYLRENLKDTVEYLVHIGVLQQVHSWRCAFCGNNNKRSLDTLKLKNSCDVCERDYQTPIDMEWKYLVSPFVVDALAKYNGSTVLWGIATLLDFSCLRQSTYLPEVNLYRDYDSDDQKNEIDLVALIDGKFVIAEVKLSAANFIEVEQEQDAFVDEVVRIQPDIAYLVFEQYCNNIEDEPNFVAKLDELTEKLKAKLQVNIELKVLVAKTDMEFSGVPIQLGPYGKRTHRALDSLGN